MSPQIGRDRLQYGMMLRARVCETQVSALRLHLVSSERRTCQPFHRSLPKAGGHDITTPHRVLSTPVAFFIFRRPECTRQVFDAIRAARQQR